MACASYQNPVAKPGKSDQYQIVSEKQFRRLLDEELPCSSGILDLSLNFLNPWSALEIFERYLWPNTSIKQEYCRECLSVLVPGELAIIDPIPLNSLFETRKDQTVHQILLDHLAERGICTVVRVAERQYADAAAERRGLASVSCEYDEATPDPGVVSAFLHTMRTQRGGGVAIHNDGAHGRAATLCALHLMSARGLSAHEAMAHIRDRCPALRLTPQQSDFLLAVAAELPPRAAPAARAAAVRRGVSRAWRSACSDLLQSAPRLESPY